MVNTTTHLFLCQFYDLSQLINRRSIRETCQYLYNLGSCERPHVAILQLNYCVKNHNKTQKAPDGRCLGFLFFVLVV